MSQQDLWTVVGRARADEAFGGRLFRNFRTALSEEGYHLSEGEIELAKDMLNRQVSPAVASAAFAPPGMEVQLATQGRILVERMEFESKLMQSRLTTQVERMNDLSQYTVKILKNTLGNATTTYRMITIMNLVMFGLGIALFLFAALYAAFSDQKIYSLVFGGLGTITFITMFLLGPIEKSQNALSNLVQVEISFMNYFEQITFWETFALTPRGTPPEIVPENIEKASVMLQERSREIVAVLQKYVETRDGAQPPAD